ncbi:uroporphyrinogen decarboxylase family protein, partial [Eubacterium aggregans]
MGKELIKQTLRHEATSEVPWVPFAGVHAGTLKGYTAKELLTYGDKLYESLMEVVKLYMPDGMPIMFDLQVEAEILGCDLLWAEDNPPSVMSHPLAGEEMKIPCSCRIPKKTNGRIPMILDVMGRMKESVGEDIALYGLICGPLTLASHLRGSEFFTDMIANAEYAKGLFDFCVEVCNAMSSYYIEAGMDVIAVVDPLVSQVSPRMQKKLFLESYKVVYDFIRSKGALSCFFVCGDATNQINVMCQTGPDGVSVDENVNIVEAKKVTDEYNTTICGNIPMTTVMYYGTQQDNMKYIVEMLDSIDHHNLIVSPGCDMPYAVPMENTIACAQAIKHPEEAREMVKNYESVDTFGDVELPDYEHLKRPFIEAFTLDTVQCTACTYMERAVQLAKDEGNAIDIA